MRPIEAAPAAVAVCNLGLEHVLANRKKDRSTHLAVTNTPADKLFRIGWNILFHDVVLAAAAATLCLLDQALRGTAKAESTTLGRAAAALRSAVAGGRPWLARRSLAPLRDHLGQATWDAMAALLDECPTLAGVLKSCGERDVTFFATHEHLEAAQGFLAHPSLVP